ncbi:uncharacterized protein [Coffea arabica]|uniref:PGG domain-containing protein n=1 Tax=Coffea arabica TaxID=13443 RepID=A0ABM4VZJ8_COFAR
MKGKWKDAKAIFRRNENAKTTKISNLGMTALHVAASCGQSDFVVQIVKTLTKKQLEATDQVGRTALHYVALAANAEAAEAMVKKNPDLPHLGDLQNLTPLFYAAKWRHPEQSQEMVYYLHLVTEEREPCYPFTGDSAADLIIAMTASGSYDTALCTLRRYPQLALRTNDQRIKAKLLLLHVAVEHRQVKIFNHIIELIGNNTKAFAELQADKGNNILHLAAKLASTSQVASVPGPAFQMQLEFQWFKAVEAIVYYELRIKKNDEGKTPRELFSDTHEKLLKNAKGWTKDLSNSCMVVATLVATVAFAAMITVPGGNDSETGMPVLARKKLFSIFSISNALSMISSAVSLLMFLSIQTSRYIEDDFLESLPKILFRGLVFLSIAVITMMISFGTTIGLSLQSRQKWAYIPITIVACFPAVIFFWLHLPLLLRTVLFHSRPGMFGGYHLLADDMA